MKKPTPNSTTAPSGGILPPVQRAKENMARRRYQQGQLFLRGKRNKVWIGRWREDQKLPDGSLKRVHKSAILGSTVDFPTRRLAQRELQTRLSHVNSITYQPTSTATFEEFSYKWEASVLPNHKPSTQNSCKAHLNKWLRDLLGKHPLASITGETIQSLVQHFSTQVEPKTVRNVLATLRMVWKSARAWGYVSHNPFEGVVLPPLGNPRRRFFTPEEVKRILTAASEPMLTFFWLAAETGMRCGELLGLRWEDVDLDTGVVQVRQSVWRGRIGTPKTSTGQRAFAISPRLVEHLVQLRRAGDSAGLLFRTRTGRPWDYRYPARALQAITRSLGMERAGLHAFRHTNATVMVAEGVDMKTVQTRLGHADPSLTLGIYAHRVSANDRAIAAKLGEIFSPVLCSSVPMPLGESKPAA